MTSKTQRTVITLMNRSMYSRQSHNIPVTRRAGMSNSQKRTTFQGYN